MGVRKSIRRCKSWEAEDSLYSTSLVTDNQSNQGSENPGFLFLNKAQLSGYFMEGNNWVLDSIVFFLNEQY